MWLGMSRLRRPLASVGRLWWGAAFLGLVLGGCASGGVPVEGIQSPSPSLSSPQVAPVPSMAPPVETVEPVGFEFEFEAPAETCVPVSVVEEMVPPGERAYALDDDLFTYMEDRIVSSCLYAPAEILDAGEEAILLEDHVIVSGRITVFRDRSDSPWAGTYPDIPVTSDDLNDWAVAVIFQRDVEGWREGCLPDGPCAEGERPTVRTDAWETVFVGFVGNLEFYVPVVYVSRDLPDDVAVRNVEIFREFVLAEVDRRAKREVD